MQSALLAECAGDPARTARFARAMVAGREDALVRTGPLVDLIDAAIAAALDDAMREDLLVLRASLRTHGLGLARIHVRLNSSQLHNAIRRQIGKHDRLARVVRRLQADHQQTSPRRCVPPPPSGASACFCCMQSVSR